MVAGEPKCSDLLCWYVYEHVYFLAEGELLEEPLGELQTCERLLHSTGEMHPSASSIVRFLDKRTGA